MIRKQALMGVLSLLVGAGAAKASELYSVHFNTTTPLYKMDQTTGAASVIGPSGFDDVGDLTSDTTVVGGSIWGVRITSNQLLKFDPMTGAAAVAVNLNSPDKMTSIAFDPVSKKLYGNTTVTFGAPFDALYEIDPNTATAHSSGEFSSTTCFHWVLTRGASCSACQMRRKS